MLYMTYNIKKRFEIYLVLGVLGKTLQTYHSSGVCHICSLQPLGYHVIKKLYKFDYHIDLYIAITTQ